MKIEINNCKRIQTGNSQLIQFKIPDYNIEEWTRLLSKEKTTDGYTLIISNEKLRSKGYSSQNHHYWGHIRTIADFMEISTSMTHSGIKGLGVDERIIDNIKNKISGLREAKSEADWTTLESAAMIELIHRFADENGIKLKED